MRRTIIVVAVMALVLGAAGAAEAGTVHLGIAVDASGSILNSEFQTVRTGLGDAIAAAEWGGGTYQLSIIMFGDGVRFVYDGAINNANKVAVGATVSAMNRSGLENYTNMGTGILYLNSLVDFSDPINDTHIYNVITDGYPNPSTQANLAISARNAAISAGLDELSSEYIGNVGETGYNFMLNSLVFPNAAPAPPYDPGFIVAVDYNTLRAALDSKLLAVTGVPLPSAAWLGLMMLGGLGAARLRRRRK